MIESFFTGPLLIKLVIASILSLIAAVLGKILWEYFSGGRVEKAPIYVSAETCLQTRRGCSINALKDRIASVYTELQTFKAERRTQQKNTDLRLEENNADVKEMRQDIAVIKEAQIQSTTLLEVIVESVKIKG